MFSLDNVSIDKLGLRYQWPKAYIAASKENVRTIQDFIDFIKKHPEYQNEKNGKLNNYTIQMRLDEIIKRVNRLSKNGKEPEVYFCEKYKHPELEYNDSCNYIDSIFFQNAAQKQILDYTYMIPVRIVKNDLSLTTSYGENQFRSYIYRLNDEKIQSIISNLNMFTEQIERQAKLTDRRDINLFLYERNMKIELLKKKYAEVIAYLIYTDKDLVWGKMNDKEKRLYLSSVFKTGTQKMTFNEHKCKELLIKQIANYTTLPELENMHKGNYNVLKRFIRKE
ncbi:MAG: hypothetical protein J5634_03655 [Bacilli bacterium]|nr:hypothetical protein [Bacilli bacterium]